MNADSGSATEWLRPPWTAGSLRGLSLFLCEAGTTVPTSRRGWATSVTWWYRLCARVPGTLSILCVS